MGRGPALFAAACVPPAAGARAAAPAGRAGNGSAARPPRCKSYGQYEGSEDATLWKDGIVFVSSGLAPSLVQRGLMLAVDLSGVEPALHSIELRGVPDGFGFRPHGIYIDNATQRLFAISHSDVLEEESIVIFDIVPHRRRRVPALEYRYALVSDQWPWHPAENIWFLNDLGVVSPSELYVTQYGPLPADQDTPKDELPVDKHLWRCTWDDARRRRDGRLPASCHTAYPAKSTGLNGMTIDASKSRVWANDLYEQRLWVFDRMPNGTLVRLEDIHVPAVVDNVEYDVASGDLAMGLIGGRYPGPETDALGGAVVARRAGGHRPFVSVEEDTGTRYQVSTSLEYGRWTLLGSPYDFGLVVCDTSRRE